MQKKTATPAPIPVKTPDVTLDSAPTTARKTSSAVLKTLLHKGAAFVINVLLMWAYYSIPPVKFDDFGNKVGGMPFADILYIAVIISSVFAWTPIFRFVFFREAAVYAESGALLKDLKRGKMTMQYQQYRLATTISFVVILAIFASLSH